MTDAADVLTGIPLLTKRETDICAPQFSECGNVKLVVLCIIGVCVFSKGFRRQEEVCQQWMIL